ncbi:MAG TPA: DUF4162 domain-containing protein, partial [Chloroflexi bacterium]|nr:DUF4162 domain-containing protein [Chloroflexota bacterium]
IRRPYMGNTLLVRTPVELPALPGVSATRMKNGTWQLTLEGGATPQSVLESLVAERIPVEHFEIAAPSLDEIFIRVVTNHESRESA